MKWFRRFKLVLQNIGDARAIVAAGGPSSISIVEVKRPTGILATGMDAVIDVAARNGEVIRTETVIPVPFPYTWAWRVGFHLQLPVVRSLDPQRIEVELPLDSPCAPIKAIGSRLGWT